MTAKEIALLGTGAGMSYVYFSQLVSKPTAKIYPLKETYLIYADTANTYAINGNNGIVEYKNPDSASTIQYAIDHSNNGIVYIQSGNYNITRTIDLGSTLSSKRQGTAVIGERTGNICSVFFVGNTGDRKAVIETSGSDGIYLSGIGILPGSTNPSGIGILQARDKTFGWAGHHLYENMCIKMTSNSSMNGGLGSVGFINLAGEESTYHNFESWANLPFMISAFQNFMITNETMSGWNGYQIVSSLGYPLSDGSATVYEFSGNGKLVAYDNHRPAFYNTSGSNINLGNTTIYKVPYSSVSPQGQNKVAIELWDTYQFKHFGNVEKSSIYLLLRRDLTQAQININMSSTNEKILPVIYLYDIDPNVTNSFVRSEIVINTQDTSRYLISGKRNDGNMSLPYPWIFTDTSILSNDMNIDSRVRI